jgi:hypothetical protein
MKRRTTTTVVGSIAGSALIVGLKLAIPAAAAEPPAVTQAEPAPVSCCPAPPSPQRLSTAATPPPEPECKTFVGDATKVARPGIGAVTVTLGFCDNTLVTATSSLSQSNWRSNPQALKAMDALTLEYYATDLSKIHFSGATLTSRAYQASLKSALAGAGL